MPHPLPGLKDDIEKLFAVTQTDKQKTLLALLVLCGLRITEAREVSPSDFDLHNMILTVRGKGDKTRLVPVSQAAWKVMSPCVVEAMLNGSQTVLTYADRHARELITRLGARAKLSRPISSHDLRSTFGALAYAETGDIRAVQELLGHASVEQTVLYTGVKLKQMRAAASFTVEV
jgi:integrase/recombinase XerC